MLDSDGEINGENQERREPLISHAAASGETSSQQIAAWILHRLGYTPDQINEILSEEPPEPVNNPLSALTAFYITELLAERLVPKTASQTARASIKLQLFCWVSCLTYIMSAYTDELWGLYDLFPPGSHILSVICTILSAGQVLYNTLTEFLAQQFLHVPDELKGAMKPKTFLEWLRELTSIFFIATLVSIPLVASFLMIPIEEVSMTAMYGLLFPLLIINAIAHVLPVRLLMKTPPYNKVFIPFQVLANELRELFWPMSEEGKDKAYLKTQRGLFDEKLRGLVTATLARIQSEALTHEFVEVEKRERPPFSWQAFLRCRYTGNDWFEILGFSEYRLKERGMVRNHTDFATLADLLEHPYAAPKKETQSQYLEPFSWSMACFTAFGCLGYMMFSLLAVRDDVPPALQPIGYAVDTPSIVCLAVLLMWVGRGGAFDLYSHRMRSKAYSDVSKTEASIAPLAKKIYPVSFFIWSVINIPYLFFTVGSANETIVYSTQEAFQHVENESLRAFAKNSLVILTTAAIFYLSTTSAISNQHLILETVGRHTKKTGGHQEAMRFNLAFAEIIRHLEAINCEELAEELKALSDDALCNLLPVDETTGKVDRSVLEFNPPKRKPGAVESARQYVGSLFRECPQLLPSTNATTAHPTSPAYAPL